MAATNFNTTNLTFRQLFGNDLTYRIPQFQRDYSWGEDEWTELWQDLEALLNGQDPVHYMGYLVLKSSGPKLLDVIDGQQRLTTLSLLVLAVLKALDDLVRSGVNAEDNKLRLEQLRSSYIGYRDPVTLVQKTKLALNRHNDLFYREKLAALQKLPTKGLRTSQRHLRKAYEWLYGKVASTYGVTKDGAKVARFIDELADKLLFTAINVTDELNAYKVFETLNARGVRLSPTDLLKNYLFSVVAKDSDNETLETLERLWEDMVDQIGSEDFSDFLRVHWNSRNDFVREAELFKRIASTIKDKGKVFDLVRNMGEDLATYLSLLSPTEEKGWSKEQAQYLRDLNLYGIRQLLSLLLAAKRKLVDPDFTKLLKACTVITFRYTVIAGLANNQLEATYSGVSKGIAEGTLSTMQDILQALRNVYVSDEAFKQAFAEREFKTSQGRSKQTARKILFALERYVSGKDYNAESPLYNVEHILPENPKPKTWQHFDAEDITDYVFRIGNLTLMDADKNREIGNSEFDRKREGYAVSDFEITKRLASEFEEWTRDQIKQRQKWMADQASSIWRVSQFDEKKGASGA